MRKKYEERHKNNEDTGILIEDVAKKYTGVSDDNNKKHYKRIPCIKKLSNGIIHAETKVLIKDLWYKYTQEVINERRVNIDNEVQKCMQAAVCVLFTQMWEKRGIAYFCERAVASTMK